MLMAEPVSSGPIPQVSHIKASYYETFSWQHFPLTALRWSGIRQRTHPCRLLWVIEGSEDSHRLLRRNSIVKNKVILPQGPVALFILGKIHAFLRPVPANQASSFRAVRLSGSALYGPANGFTGTSADAKSTADASFFG